MIVQSMVRNAILLGIFAVLGTGMVALTHENTKSRIAENQRQALLANLHELVPPNTYNNDIIGDHITVTDQDMLGTADLGNIAYESEAMEGMIIDEQVMLTLNRFDEAIRKVKGEYHG